MSNEVERKIRTRLILFIVFLILTIIFLIGAVIGGIKGRDDIINTMAFIFGIPCVLSLILTIIFGVKFRRLAKKRDLIS